MYYSLVLTPNYSLDSIRSKLQFVGEGKSIANVRRTPESLLQKLEYMVSVGSITHTQMDNLYIALITFIRSRPADYVQGKLEIQLVAGSPHCYNGGSVVKITFLFQPKLPTASSTPIYPGSDLNGKSGSSSSGSKNLAITAPILIDSSARKLKRIMAFNQEIVRAAEKEGICLIETQSITTVQTSVKGMNLPTF